MKKLITLLTIAALMGTGCASMNKAQKEWNEARKSQPTYGGFNPYLFGSGMYLWGASQNRVLPSSPYPGSIRCTTNGVTTVCH